MEWIIVSACALLASMLTLFSGFGLGTLLMPVVALFFPLEVAIALTAVVHLANNVFKAAMLGRHADRSVLLAFGLPSLLAALVGAWVLTALADLPPILRYPLFDAEQSVRPVKLAIGSLILVFAVLEMSPRFARLSVPKRFLPLGGFLSGFFGGLSGHQGALRSLFLVKAGLSKEAYLGTGVLVALAVDLSRLGVYATAMAEQAASIDWGLAASASVAAFAGAFAGTRLMHKVTLVGVQRLVAALLFVVGLGLVSGLL